ncbi:hypothetical protein KPH14_012964, partial [Odynerus spinipes]
MAVARSPNRTTRGNNQNSGIEEEERDEEMSDDIQTEWQRLREEQRKLEEMRAEIERLRASIPVAANTRGRTGRKGATRDPGDSEERIVSGVMNQLQYMQLDIKPPKFSDEQDKNPKEFLAELENFFQFKHVREEHKVLVTENLLDGRAKVWANSMTHTFTDFNAFREAFLHEFYSIPIKVKLKTQWLSQRYRYNEGTMQEYFYKQRRMAKNLEPHMSAYELNYTIVQQFPMRIREALAACDHSDIDAVAQALSRLDSIQRDRDFEKKRNAWNREYRQNEHIDARRADANVYRIRLAWLEAREKDDGLYVHVINVKDANFNNERENEYVKDKKKLEDEELCESINENVNASDLSVVCEKDENAMLKEGDNYVMRDSCKNIAKMPTVNDYRENAIGEEEEELENETETSLESLCRIGESAIVGTTESFERDLDM